MLARDQRCHLQGEKHDLFVYSSKSISSVGPDAMSTASRTSPDVIPKVSTKMDKKMLLSTLWIVVLINMLKADVLSLYIPGVADELARFAGDTPITLLMLAGAILVEISTVMIILSRVLPYRVNRWANMVASVITLAGIWGAGSNYPHYIFIATVETICLVLIIWNAWRWVKQS